MTRDDLAVLSEPLRQAVEANRRAIEANGTALAEAADKLEARDHMWSTSYRAPLTVGVAVAIFIVVVQHLWK